MPLASLKHKKAAYFGDFFNNCLLKGYWRILILSVHLVGSPVFSSGNVAFGLSLQLAYHVCPAYRSVAQPETRTVAAKTSDANTDLFMLIP